MPAKIKQEVINELITFYKNNNCTYKDASIHVGINRHVGARYLRENGLGRSKNNKTPCHDQIFNKIDSEEKAYWLGFLYADGNVGSNKNSVSLGLALKDKNHVQKLSNMILKKHAPIKMDHFRARFQVGSKHIRKSLIKLGCVPRKSTVLRFPDKNQVPKKYLRDFIRGYFDGDGCLSLQEHTNKFVKNRWSIALGVLGTKEFIRDLNIALNIKNPTIKLANKHSTANCYQCFYNKAQMEKILEYMYKDCNIYLKRKYNKVVKYCRENEKSFLLSESKYGEG